MRHLILCALLLCASGLQASSGEITLFEVRFAEGVWNFSQNDNVSAVERFREALQVRPGDGLARYLLGLSHLRLGETAEAEREIAAGLAAVPPPPVERSRILVDLGAAQLAEGKAEAAIATLSEALRERAGDAVALHHYAAALALVGRNQEAESARAWARVAEPFLNPEDLPVTTPKVAAGTHPKEGPRWGGSLALMAGYDSNPNLLSEDLLLPVPSRNELVNGSSSDLAAGADFRVSHRPIHLPAGWSLGLDLRGGGSFHQDFEYLDVARAAGNVQVGRRLGREWSLSLQTGIEEVFLDRSSYLRTTTGGASLTFAPTAASATRLDVWLLDRSYADHSLADPRREGEDVRIGLRQIRYFGGNNRYVSLGIATADRSADRAFERSLLEGEVQVALPLGQRWALDFSGWLNEEDFSDPASNLFDPQGQARQDRTWGAAAGVSFSLTQRLQILARGSYSERSSNLDLGEDLPDLDYRRTVLGTGFTWSF